MEDGERSTGDLPGYVPTGEYWRIQEMYGDWVYSKYGEHLIGWMANYNYWQVQCIILVVMPMHRYDALSRRVGRRFVHMLTAERTGVRQRQQRQQRRCNAERFIVFQTVILQRSRNMTSSRATLRKIDSHLNSW